MAVEGNTWRAPKGFFGPVVSAAVLLAAVGGCSRVPDATNRVEWYKHTMEYYAGEDTYRMRAVTHLDVDRAGVEEAAHTLEAVVSE